MSRDKIDFTKMLKGGDDSLGTDPPSVASKLESSSNMDSKQGSEYGGWHLPMKKANTLLKIISQSAPVAARATISPFSDTLDLTGFQNALSGLETLSRAISRVRETLPYLENEVFRQKLSKYLESGALENRQDRVRFVKQANLAWGIRKQQLGEIYKSEISASDTFLLGNGR